MRIFMVGYSTDMGGVESYITNLCSYLGEKYEIIYCWPEMDLDGKKWICPKNRHNYLRYYMFWKKFFNKNKFDVIYYNTCDVVSIDMLKFAKNANIPIRIIHSHNTNVQFKLSFFHKYTEKRNKKKINLIATDLLACSESAGKWMFPNKEYTIIKNGILIEKYLFNIQYRRKCRSLIQLKEEFLVGCVGRLDFQKNPIFSVKVMKAIANKLDNVKFVFIGDGEFKPQVEERINVLGLKDSCFVLGAQDNANEWYSALDCLLMPSLFEGLPFTLVEAQTSGLSCIVSSTVSQEANITGLVEYISLKEKPEEWANLVIKHLKDKRKDVSNLVVDKGYSINDAANVVDQIIINRYMKINGKCNI